MNEVESLYATFHEYRNLLISSNNIFDPDLERYRQIINDIRDLNRRVQEAIVDIHRGRVGLTPEQIKRVDFDERSDRIIDRVKPFLLLSQIIEDHVDENRIS